jgi:hypothetical protein
MKQDEERHDLTARRLAVLLDEPEQHLDFDAELSPYVDGTLDAAGREIVETHVEDCAMCREELEDLQQFAGERQAPPRRTAALAVAAAAVVAVVMLYMGRPETVPADVEQPGPAMTVTSPPPPPAVSPQPAYANHEWARLVADVLESGRLPRSKVSADLRGSTDDTLRGGSDDAGAALSPAGVVVESTRPRFTWPPSHGASYVVSIFSNEEEVVSTPPITSASWQLDRDLVRGRTYTWQVAVTRGGATEVLPVPPAPPARFHILGEREHEELEAARRQHPGDALLLAALYARNGLAAEAEAEVAKLRASADPRVQRVVSGAGQDADPTSTNAAQ